MRNTITVPIKLSKEDIEILAEELNTCDSSPLTFFLENVLKQAAASAAILERRAEEIRRVNPFSRQGAKNEKL